MLLKVLILILLVPAASWGQRFFGDDVHDRGSVVVSIGGEMPPPDEVDIYDDSIEEREHEHEDSTRHPFEKFCPYGYFKCTNDECIAERWRCDGHYDCDDFSDEMNCTNFELPTHPILRSPPAEPANKSQAHTPPALKFNSSIEPLMIFSTGSSIRGLWMGSNFYFDIASRNASLLPTQPSISEAFSVFFGNIFQPPSSPGATASSAAAARPTSGPGQSKRRSTIVGLDMDHNNREVFWVELGKEPGVYSAPVDENIFAEATRQRRQLPQYKKRVDFDLLAPEDIALDTVGRNAYITDAGIPAIVACSYINGHCKIIVTVQLHKPRAIIADSSTGWVTFTDWGDRPGIYLTSMDGRRFETLIESDVVWPNGLAADPSTDSLYWADARLNKIERIDLKTRVRTIVIKEKNTNPFSVSLFENRIYWSDWSKNEIKTCNKLTGNDTQVVIHVEDIYGIHIYHPDLYKEDQSNPCWSKRCSHMCLLSPGSAAYALRATTGLRGTCACPETMMLSHLDRATCYRHPVAHARPHTQSPPSVPKPQPQVVIPIHHDVNLTSSTTTTTTTTTTTHPHHEGTTPKPTTKPVTHKAPESSEIVADRPAESNKMVWLIVFLLILSATGLVTVLSLLLLHRQGRLPRQVSVSFVSPARAQDKDRAMLLLDTDS